MSVPVEYVVFIRYSHMRMTAYVVAPSGPDAVKAVKYDMSQRDIERITEMRAIRVARMTEIGNEKKPDTA